MTVSETDSYSPDIPVAAHFDLAIVGGGMSGVTAALSYAQLGYRVALIEAIEPVAESSPSFDQRAIALSASSVAIYRSLGLWPVLQPYANPIEQIHVSDRGNPGFTRLYAKDYAIASLGEVIPLESAGSALWQQARQHPLIETYCPVKVSRCQQSSVDCQIALEWAESSQADHSPSPSISAKLVLAADGTYSSLAAANQMTTQRVAYAQHAVIANIQCEKNHANRAFERFTTEGPLALLPLTQNRVSLVWCHRPENIDDIMGLSDEAFVTWLQRAFGYRLGRITRVGRRFQYPLSLHMAEKPFVGRVLLLGNALHTLHPIAGQGFNLGLRDIAALNDLLLEAREQGVDIGSAEFLQRYVSGRQPDWQQTLLATDALARLFSNQFLPLVLLRNKAMSLINTLPFAKHHLANAAMGYQQRSSRLARGLANPPLTPGMST